MPGGEHHGPEAARERVLDVVAEILKPTMYGGPIAYAGALLCRHHQPAHRAAGHEPNA
jgi:hypothetical protein